MRFTCRTCGGPAIITNKNRISADYAELYVSCKDHRCGHRWVESLGFKHDLSPSQKAPQDGYLMTLISSMRPEERNEVVAWLKQNSTPARKKEQGPVVNIRKGY